MIINSKPVKQTLIVLATLTIGVSGYFYILNTGKQQQINDVSNNNFKFGLSNHCRSVPKFIPSLKMTAPSLDSRQQDGSMGLQIRDYAHKNKTWQHQSWLKPGYIGAFDRDQQGNVYVTPMPYVSLLKNPPEEQSQIYIIDSKTAEMSLFMKLPTEGPPNSRNPFGAMGLYYDCDTQSLYVSSLAGSKPMQENGVIYQIDIKTRKIVSTLKNIDVIGLGVFNTKKGKRLYFGSARNSYLYSISLDKKGQFFGEKKYELSLSKIKGGDSTIIKKIKFSKKENSFNMTLKEIEFGFRLLAENNPYKKKYHFKLDESGNKWNFERLSKD